MKTQKTLYLLALSLLLVLCSFPVSAAENELLVFHGSSPISSVVSNGVRMVDACTFCEEGYYNDFNHSMISKETATYKFTTSEGVVITVTVGSKKAYVNGNPVELLAAPFADYEYPQKLYVPLDFIVTSTGGYMTMDSKANSLYISTSGKPIDILRYRKLSPTPTPLLGGRLYANMPEGTYPHSSPLSEAEFSFANARFDEVMVHEGPQTLCLTAWDRFMYSSGDLLKDAASLGFFDDNYNRIPYKATSKTTSSGGLDMLILIAEYREIYEPLPICAALIRLPDNSLITLNVSSYAYSHELYMSDLDKIANQILMSVKLGERGLNASKRTVKFYDWQMTCPAGYAYYYPSYVFPPYILTKILSEGESPAEMYVNFEWEKYEWSVQKDKVEQGKILGQTVQWVHYKEKNFNAAYACAAIGKDDGAASDPEYIRFYIEYQNEADFKALKKAAESLK